MAGTVAPMQLFHRVPICQHNSLPLDLTDRKGIVAGSVSRWSRWRRRQAHRWPRVGKRGKFTDANEIEYIGTQSNKGSGGDDQLKLHSTMATTRPTQTKAAPNMSCTLGHLLLIPRSSLKTGLPLALLPCLSLHRFHVPLVSVRTNSDRNGLLLRPSQQLRSYLTSR